MEHQVQARRHGRNAILHCEVCGAERPLVDGDFEALNAFIQEHKACAQPWPDGEAVRWDGLAGGRP